MLPPQAASAALSAFIASPAASMADAMAEAIAAALPYLSAAGKPLPDQEDYADHEVARIDLSHNGSYQWAVRSTCGVVKIWSSRDGCMLAVAPTTARHLARELSEALEDAASHVERRSRGEQ